MNVNLPEPPVAVGKFYMTQLVQQLVQLFARVRASNEAAPFVILQSPDGRSWNVTVDNAGALVVAINTTPPGSHLP